MKIFFLHIPKTAGQSVHAALEEGFGKENVCPARINSQLQKLSINELNKYSVFSGHLDWSLLDCVEGKKYTFTVLRKPKDRILSFYCYLRDKAEFLSDEELGLPQNQGLKAIKEMSVDDYFLRGRTGIRNFIDSHYDNFYAYYFAMRRYNAYNECNSIVNTMNKDKKILALAEDNLKKVDDIFCIQNMNEVFKKISILSGKSSIYDKQYRVNVNRKSKNTDRISLLESYGATKKTLERIDYFTRMDDLLWDEFFKS